MNRLKTIFTFYFLMLNPTNFLGLNNIDSVMGKVDFRVDHTNFIGLENLKYIGGDLLIHFSDHLINLEGLSGLTRVDGLVIITENPSLNNLQGIDNLQYIGNRLIIDRNVNLESSLGFNALSEIESHVVITRNGELNNLQGFSNLKKVGGNMTLSFVQSSLSGLENLTEVLGDLQITSCNIEDLEGLNSLKYVGDFLNISFNPNLLSLSGLQSLDSLPARLDVTDNNRLNNLEGLNNLRFIGEKLDIENNPRLQSLNGLDSLQYVGGYLGITNNDSLINMQGLIGLDSVGAQLLIDENRLLLNLQGLNNLQKIGDYFGLWRNFLFNSVAGLDKLVSIGANFTTDQNNLLKNFEGLESLISIGKDLRINNAKLESLKGLENLTNITGELNITNADELIAVDSLLGLDSLGGNIIIRNADKLKNIDGLENLKSINGYISIFNNDDLISIAGLNGLEVNTISNLELTENNSLSICNEPVVCNYLNSGGPFSILNNSEGCNSETELLYACGELSKVVFEVFYDFNQNKIRDSTEQLYPIASVAVLPQAEYYYTNPYQTNVIGLGQGDYTVVYNPLMNWELTSDSASYDLSLNDPNSCDTLVFGILPVLDSTKLLTNIFAPPSRCLEWTTLDVQVKNSGTTTTSGTLWFEMDERILDSLFFEDPDTLVGSHLFGWHYSNLQPGYSFDKSVQCSIPGPLTITIGDTLIFNSYSEFIDVNGSQVTDTFGYETNVLCAFDPNDKLTYPNRPDEFYTRMNEEIIYTIRFQNTGNAEAFNVVIRDTLDQNLDLTTFEILATSHPTILSTSISEGEYINFNFFNIFLPDSTSNFEASQGYVSYKISVNKGLENETVVNNSASIYFDQNPPIHTNSTINLMVNHLPWDDNDSDGSPFAEDCDDFNENIYPGALEIPNNDIDEDCNGEDLLTAMKILGGNVLEVFPNPANEVLTINCTIPGSKQIEIHNINGSIQSMHLMDDDHLIVKLNDLSSGIYFVKLTSEEGTSLARFQKL